jgi:hypothetical protein
MILNLGGCHVESENSGERASGVRNHTRLCLGLFVRHNSGLNGAGSQESGSKDRLAGLSGFRFERLCLHGLAIMVGGKLKHLSLRLLVTECLSLTSTFFSARPVSLASRDKGSLVRWQFASPEPHVTQVVQQDGGVAVARQALIHVPRCKRTDHPPL